MSGYYLNGSCYTQCPSGYYNSFSNNTCEVCGDARCLQCTTKTNCLHCSNGTYLFNSQCLTLCPARTYPSMDLALSSWSCSPCASPCFECLNETACLSCQVGYMSYMQPNKCVADCENSSYPCEIANPNYTTLTSFSTIRVLKTCKPCSSECRTCKNNLGCLTCADSNKILNGQSKCVASCPPGYYNQSRICETCNYPCITCMRSPTTCISCS